ncbi:MAG TPA: metalloregulator ArsR/SmtB family transcription factor [Kiritimatiellia bacterium]|nr:metalloregulator ArsR/SmtB family transcription factor [Kiritimatiellia bacterium]
MIAVAPIEIFRALADEVRLRLLSAVLTSELSVAELVHALGLPQSTVSRHLKPLRDAGLVETRRDGTSVYYRKGAALTEPTMFRLLEDRLKYLPTAPMDRNAVRRVLDLRKQRSRDFFDRMAGTYNQLTEPGGGWSALAAGFAAGFRGQVVADLGAGEGALSLLLARFAKEVIAVDQSSGMLKEVEIRAKQQGFGAVIRTVESDFESLPLPDQSVQAVFLSQALHHASDPAAALREAARILGPDGQLILLDLARHDQEWVRDQWADVWLGFEPADIRQWLADAGLEAVICEVLEGSVPEFQVLLAVARAQSSSTPIF